MSIQYFLQPASTQKHETFPDADVSPETQVI